MRNKILDMIYNNSRIDIDDIAVMVGATKEEVEAEIAAMEKEGIICGYPTMVNWEKTDQEKVSALIEVRVTPQRGLGFDKIAERIYRFDEVESVSLMSGGFDLSVTIEGKSMREVARFVHEKLAPLEAVQSTSTYFVLKKYKEHGVIIADKKPSEGRMKVSP